MSELTRPTGIPDVDDNSDTRTLSSKDVADAAFDKWLRDSPLHLRGDFAAFHAGFKAGRAGHETECPLPASDRNTILDAMHYPREYLARWKGKGNSANAQHTLDRLQNMLERTQAGDRKETVSPLSTAVDFVSYDSAGGVQIDLASYLRTPAGQAQLQSLSGKKAAGSPSEAAMQIIAAVCHSVSGTCCHVLKDGQGPCTIENCSAVRGYLGAPNGS